MPAPFTSIVVNMKVRQYLGGNNPLTQSQKKCLSDTFTKMIDGSIKLRISISPKEIRFIPVIACEHIIDGVSKTKVSYLLTK